MERPALGNTKRVSVYAPASVGNVAVGFDVLGHAIQGAGDKVTVERSAEPGIRVVSVTGVVEDLPLDPESNTAAAAVAAMVADLELEAGFEIYIDKGIPLGSGLGGSAASAVGAVVAVNQMLKIHLPLAALYPYALAGEMAATGSGNEHGDNVAASLLGGLAAVGPAGHRRPLQIPVPNRLRCTVVRPHLQIETRGSRGDLPDTFQRETAVKQMANLAAFITACHSKDIDVIGECLVDLLVEDRRARRIPGFGAAKAAALDAGALGCSVSGSGPSVFAWFRTETAAIAGGEAMAAAFTAADVESTTITSPVACPGARVVPSPEALADNESE